MPKFMFPVPETENCVLRPAMTEVARRVMDITGIDKEKTQLFFPTAMGTIAQPGSTISSNPDANNFASDQRFYVEVEEEPDEDTISSTAVNRPENRLIFLDNDLGVVIRPVFSMMSVTLTFKFRAKDEVLANRWRNLIRQQVSDMDVPHLQDITYSYAIPGVMLVILEEVHRLRELVAPFGQTFNEYLQGYGTKRLSVQTNLIGNSPTWAVAETQVKIPAWFDFTAKPEKGDIVEGVQSWDISFSYKFKYDKIDDCFMTYPIVVHNQLLDQGFRPTEEDRNRIDYDKRKISYTASMEALHRFEPRRALDNQKYDPGYFLPAFDEFAPGFTLPNTIRVFTGLTLIDPDTPQLLMDFNDLGDYTLDPSILAFLKKEAQYCTLPDRSVFTLSVYRDLDMLNPSLFKMDANSTVTLVNAPEMRSTYHVRLGLNVNLRTIDPAAITRARNSGPAFILILLSLYPGLDPSYIPPLLNGVYLPAKPVDKIIDVINQNVTPDSLRRGFNTVQTLFIETSHASY